MPLNPTEFAAAIRELAVRAHRALGAPDPSEACELERRAAALESQAQAWSAHELTAWLRNMRKQLSAARRGAHDRLPVT